MPVRSRATSRRAASGRRLSPRVPEDGRPQPQPESANQAAEKTTQSADEPFPDANALVAAARLLPELFLHVMCLLCFRDRLRASGVCRRWRSTALAFAHLWADIPVLGALRLAVQEQILERTRPLPLRLAFCFKSVAFFSAEGYNKRCLAHVRAHLDHIQSLAITLNAPDELAIILGALSRPAELLEELHITILSSAWRSTATESDWQDLFQCTSPRLRRVTLLGVSVPTVPVPAFRAAQVYSGTLARDAILQPNNPGVPLTPPAPVPGPAIPAIPPAPTPAVTLPAAHIPVQPVQSPPDPPRPTRLCLNAPTVRDCMNVWKKPCERYPSRYVLLSAFAGGKSEQGFSALARDVRTGPHPSHLLQALGSRLRSLTLEPLSRPGRAHKVQLPQLRYLHLVLPSPALPLWLSAPGLRVVRISVVPDHGGCPPHGGDVVSFLSSLGCKNRVDLELEGFANGIPSIPAGFVQRAVSAAATPPGVGSDYIDRCERWDDALEDILDHMP
ncbi:hypothetical protein AURDEDRAFT_129261 [Auricularia subglabra TFB-10046 SS5]|nr:hypothetical protein AURDEDRAFT_129261 [Auricularia subglabra TFB-10046 SS5]